MSNAHALSGNDHNELVEGILANLLDLAGDIHDDEGELIEPIMSWIERYDASNATPELHAKIYMEISTMEENETILSAVNEFLECYPIGALALDIALTRQQFDYAFSTDRPWLSTETASTLNKWANSLPELNLFEGHLAIPEHATEWAGMFHAE